MSGRKPPKPTNGNGHSHDGGTPYDPDWDNLGRDTQRFSRRMSEQSHRQTTPDSDDEPPPIEDPRDRTDFRAVWDKLASNTETSRLIDYINGATVEPLPTLQEIVAAFFDAGAGLAVIPKYVSTVITLCGGQLSRQSNLHLDVDAEWDKLWDDQIRGGKRRQEAREQGVPQAQTVPVFLKGSLPPSYSSSRSCSVPRSTHAPH